MPKKLPDPGTVFEITMPEGDFIYARLYHSLKLGIFEGRYPSYPGFTNKSAVSFYTWGDYDVLTLRIVDHIPFDNWNEASGPAKRLPDSSPGIIARMFYRIYYRGEIKKCFYNKYKEALPHKGYRSKEIAYRENGLWFDDNGREVPEHPFNRLKPFYGSREPVFDDHDRKFSEGEDVCSVTLFLSNRATKRWGRCDLYDYLLNWFNRHHSGEIIDQRTVVDEEQFEPQYGWIQLKIEKKYLRELIDFVYQIPGLGKGSYIETGGKRYPVGKAEGVGVYINGIDWPRMIYKKYTPEDLYKRIEKELLPDERLMGSWNGETETGLYFYGPDQKALKEKIGRITEQYPLAEKIRVTDLNPAERMYQKHILFWNKEVQPVKTTPQGFGFLKINGKIGPEIREEYFEKPLDSWLLTKEYGEVTGGGTLLDSKGQLFNAGVDLRIEDGCFEALAAYLKEWPVLPEGSSIEYNDQTVTAGKAKEILIRIELPENERRKKRYRDFFKELNQKTAGEVLLYDTDKEGNTDILHFYSRNPETLIPLVAETASACSYKIINSEHF